jgi:exopolyphosphatase/guanosine-5'-triphosphate,3'-diphosphate pyrophosphatase
VQPRAATSAARAAWACALHEVGMMVSHHDHHRHSAYVLAHVDAPGFSQSQQRRLGELVLAQRGGLRKVEASLRRKTFAWQVLCLRLAIIACHARGDVDPTRCACAQRRHAPLRCRPAGPRRTRARCTCSTKRRGVGARRPLRCAAG